MLKTVKEKGTSVMKLRVATVVLIALMTIGAASAQYTVNYGDVTLNPGFSAGNFADIWDLTQGDLTLSYTVDLSDVTGPTSYTQVGIRQVGASNFNPGPFGVYQGGAGGWMTSTVTSVASNPNSLNHNDKHNLGASGGRGEGDYDVLASDPTQVVAPPVGSFNSYGIWFDRDGVDQWQATHWGAVDGGTYNTGGIYDIVLTYRAIDDNLGTVFASVNGIQQGFNPGVNFFEAGLSFKGNMKQMQVFYGLWTTMGDDGGPVHLSDILVDSQAPPVPEPMSMALVGLGLSAVAGLRKRSHKA